MGMDLSDVIDDMKSSIDKSLEALRRELAKLRTGRANPALLDGIRVDYYGQMTPVSQMATVLVPEPRLIIVKPWDKSQVKALEKAIMSSSDLGLTPSSDGEVIRIPIPTLTEERRRDLTKISRKDGEECKVSIRNGRRDANEMIKEIQNDGDAPEDDCHKATKKVQDLTDDAVRKVDEIVAAKEKEILEG